MDGEIFSYSFNTPLGEFKALQRGECIISFLPSHMKKDFAQQMLTPLFKELYMQVDAYFLGKLKKFDLPLCHQIEGFYGRVLDYLVQIHYGDKLSYAQVAARLHAPRAFRAVGNACAKNPLPILIPCHRVVAKSHIGGYALGLEAKSKLLILEGIRRF